MRPLAFLVLVSLARPAFAQDPVELPTVGETAVATESAVRKEDGGDLGLEILWLPLESRTDLADHVGRNVPGALRDGGGLHLRGGGSGDNAFFVDEFELHRPTLPLGMLNRLEVATAGYGAQWTDVAGGVVSLGTRSGGNKWHASIDLHRDFRDRSNTVLAPTISGPIVRNRLFYLLALRGQITTDVGEKDVYAVLPDPPPRQSSALGGGLKLTWLPHFDHRIESLTLLDADRIDNGGGLGVSKEAQPTFSQRGFFTGLRWVGRFADVVTARAQVAYDSARGEERPQQCREDPALCETIAAEINFYPLTQTFKNWPRHQIQHDSGWQLSGAIEARLFTRPWFEQRLRVSSRLAARQFSWASRPPGGRVLESNGLTPSRETVTFANDPRLGPALLGWSQAGGSSLRTVHALQSESLLWGRLTMVPGLALVTSGARTDQGMALEDLAVTPHVGLAWDVTGDRQTWLRASTHQRLDADLGAFARSSLGTPVSRSCRWDETTGTYSKDCALSGGGGTVGMPCAPTAIDPAGASCSQRIRLPRTWEHTVGAARELGLGFRLGLDFVYRRASGLPVLHETNRIWNASEATTQGGFRDGRAQTVLDMSTAAGAWNRYLGVTGTLEKRAGALKMLLAYTWSHHRGTALAGSNQAWGDIAGRDLYLEGDLADDRRHTVHALFSYDVLGYGSFGAIFTGESGAPYSRLFRNDVTGNFEDYRARVGVNPGAAVNDPSDDRAMRLAGTQRLNFQLRLRAKRLVGVDLDVYGDIINVFDWGVVTYEDLYSFNNTYRRQERRAVRMGVEYRY